MLEALRQEVHALHLELPRHGLVSWTSGNVSARDPATGLVVIKPSGVRYPALTPASLVVVELSGRVIEGDLLPSSDTASHLVIYRARPDVFGVVHTHSPHATAFAAVGRDIPAALTALADEFGGPVRCTPYAPVGGEEIGRAALETARGGRAVLLRSHGVVTMGASAAEAVRAAIVLEEGARTLLLAEGLGPVLPLPESEVARAHARYTNAYGQGDSQRSARAREGGEPA